ncbi:hypothetical protein E4T43_01249 [Aureobasidium subglaciale]|nr:hypothetical protein E4T43_01249 [Aureobasidium subglaciale]
MARYEEETVAKLRQELKKRDIPSTGLNRKQQIIEKLEENDAEKGQEKSKTKDDRDEVEDKKSTGSSGGKDDQQSVPSKRPAEDTESKDVKKTRTESSEDKPKGGKPRLTTPDIEFDYDRSQLRDPRPTPGRVRRPKYTDMECPEDLKKKFETEYEIPKPEKPPGRLNAFQKNALYCEEAKMNPFAFSHDKQIMEEKGPDGSPTYDQAGFEIDYEKYINGTSRTYNKKSMIRNMDKAVDKAKSEEEQIFDLFFLPNEKPDEDRARWVKDYIKDQVSKDLDVPWHQVQPEHLKQWREKGFERVAFKDWWKDPTEIEQKRMENMTMGSVFRKDL